MERTWACVRRAGPGDVQAIARALEAAFGPYRGQYTAAAYRATVIEGAEIAGRVAAGTVWVAVSSGQVVGTVSAVATSEGVYVRSMAVSPEAQGRGVGRALLEAAEAFARERGAARVYLSTTPFLASAIRLYERCGFARCEGGPAELAGTPLMTMERSMTTADLRSDTIIAPKAPR